tara:strand:- start:249 stop:587 length:339 start_codon:yes stop_codon:yes gene_type:complete
MIWPPVKAWTSIDCIDGQAHFVAINYGGRFQARWVIMMSVLDAGLVIKVYWSQLIDQSEWKCGWDDNNNFVSFKLIDRKCTIETTKYILPSDDSGLTIPITRSTVRPWFYNI